MARSRHQDRQRPSTTLLALAFQELACYDVLVRPRPLKLNTAWETQEAMLGGEESGALA